LWRWRRLPTGGPFGGPSSRLHAGLNSASYVEFSFIEGNFVTTRLRLHSDPSADDATIGTGGTELTLESPPSAARPRTARLAMNSHATASSAVLDVDRITRDALGVLAGNVPLLAGRFGGLVGPLPPAVIDGQFFWQGGTTLVATNAAGDAVINFPVAFPNGLTTLVTSNGNADALPQAIVGARYSQYSLAAFTVRVYQGGVAFVGNVTVNWMALGW
jgi:hypothetical protein